jgi:hypothetical protein
MENALKTYTDAAVAYFVGNVLMIACEGFVRKVWDFNTDTFYGANGEVEQNTILASSIHGGKSFAGGFLAKYRNEARTNNAERVRLVNMVEFHFICDRDRRQDHMEADLETLGYTTDLEAALASI